MAPGGRLLSTGPWFMSVWVIECFVHAIQHLYVYKGHLGVICDQAHRPQIIAEKKTTCSH